MMTYLSDMARSVIFASCYVYSPGGSGAASERSRLMRSLLKDRDAYFMDKYADRVRQQVAEGPSLTGFLNAGSVLVPIPGSARRPGAASVADHLASALLSEGLGLCIWRGLERICPVRKSATAAPGLRPTVAEHYQSFAVAAPPPPLPSQRIVLVDDVVTKGRTLLAAATRMREAYPAAEVRAFALIRTMGLIQGVDHLLEPCVGEIRWSCGDAHRTP
jgi:predicted amidophosphoribosyltransferase